MMKFPSIDEKWREPGLFSAQDFVTYLKKQGRQPKNDLPQRMIISYSSNIIKQMQAVHKAREFSLLGISFTAFQSADESEVYVAHGFGIGAPAAVVAMELLFALGVREFIHVGTAGSLQPQLRQGDLVICDRAIRDEGTSRNYLPPSEMVMADPQMVEHWGSKLTSAGLVYRRGSSWTTDAPYRETAKEVVKYRERGVLTVEMEAAAVMALAQYHQVKSISFFVISDELSETGWTPQFHSKKMQQTRQKLFRLLAGLKEA